MNQLPTDNNQPLAFEVFGPPGSPDTWLQWLPTAVLVVAGTDYKIRLANRASYRLLQQTESGILGNPLFSVLPGWKQPAIETALLQALRANPTEGPVEVTIEWGTPPATLLLRLQPVADKEGIATSIVIQVEQIAAATHNLVHTTSKYKTSVLDALPFLAWIVAADGSPAYVNQQASLFAHPNRIHWSWLQLVHPDEYGAVAKTWQQSILQGAAFKQECRLQGANGLYRWHRCQAHPQKETATGTIYWVATATDIQEQKETEQALKEQETLAYTILEASPNWISMLDTDGRLRYLNYNGQQLIEVDNFQSVQSRYWWELWDGTSRERIKEAMKQALEGAAVNFQGFCPTTKGNPKWWDVVLSAVPDSDGNSSRLLVIARDITAQQEASDRMHQLSRHLQLSTRAAQAGTWEVATATQKLEWSALHKELWGYPEDFEGITPSHWQIAIVPEDEPYVVAHFNHTEQEHLPVDVSYRIRKVNDGSIRWVRSLGNYTYNDAGVATTISGICLDITEQKLAEERLRQSEARFRRIFYNSPIAIWEEDFSEVKKSIDALATSGITDLDAFFSKHQEQLMQLVSCVVVTDVNEAAQAMYGGNREEALACLPHLFIESTLAAFLEELKIIARGGGRFETETLVQNKWGEKLNVLVRIDFPVDDDYRSIQVILIDITQRKIAEEKIRESERRFRILADTLPQMVWMMNAEGHFEYASDQWLHYSGISEIRAAWRTMIHPADAEHMMPAWQACMAAGTPFRYEIRLKNKEGEYRWHYSIAEPVKDEEGNVIRWIGAMTDIHTQKTFSEQLETEVSERTGELNKLTHQLKSLNSYLLLQNQTFNHAEKASRQGSFFWDPATDTVTYSDNLYRLLGMEPGSFAPGFRNLRRFIHPHDLPSVETAIKLIKAVKMMPDKAFRIVRPDGAVRHVQASGRTVHSDGAEVIIGTLRDVTEDVLLRQKLQANNLELERSNADLQQFAHVASHDLKEPVRKIRFFGSCLHSEFGHLLPDKAITYLQKIENAAGRMSSMVEGVLQYSALSNDASEPESIALPDVLRSIEADLELMIREKEAHLHYGALPAVQGYGVLIHQLFYNLVNNALKFSKAGTPPLIQITGRQDDQQVVIEVSDNGIGFEQQHAQQIFKTFARLNAKDEYEGTGLGLALCQKIVERHGGTITAQGVDGGGATFKVVLPAANNGVAPGHEEV